MGETTGIAWTDHTFNPWIGCTKVSQGCKLCYAERDNKLYKWVPEWGPGQPRRRTSEANWEKPIQWAKKAVADKVTRRVFCSSLADVLDDEVDPYWRQDLFHLIERTRQIGGLEWLLLTKREASIEKMMPLLWLDFPPANVRLGVTAENQANADKRIPELLRVWKGKNFVSIEPMLGSVNIAEHLAPFMHVQVNGNISPQTDTALAQMGKAAYRQYVGPLLDWVICGGESGPNARPMHPDWARSLRNQCVAAGVPFLFKQWGEWAHLDVPIVVGTYNGAGAFVKHDGALGNQGDYWEGRAVCMDRVGKKAAGNLLDGQTWHQFPSVSTETE